MAVSPVQALRERIFEARSRFRYIPDSEGGDPLEQLQNDHWATEGEFEAKGGGDCEDWANWALCRAAADSLEIPGPTPPTWFLIAGTVMQRGVPGGHAWVGLVWQAIQYWADPTWGELPQSPARLGYPESRTPQMRWIYDGRRRLFLREEHYPQP